MTNAITVPFHGNTLYVVDQQGQPFAPMKPIVEGMGLSWQGQHEKLKSNVERWGIKEILMPSAGGNQAMVCMPLRKLPGWLMTIHPNKVKADRREAIIRFQNECDDVLWDYWTKGQATTQNGLKSLEPPTLTASEQQTLSEIVDVRARDFGPLTGKAKAEVWSRVHRKFRVAKYQQLPREQLADAIAYVMNMEIRTQAPEPMPVPELPAPIGHAHYPYAREQLSSLYDWGKRALPPSVQEAHYQSLKELERSLVTGWTEIDESLMHITTAVAMLKRWKRGC